MNVIKESNGLEYDWLSLKFIKRVSQFAKFLAHPTKISHGIFNTLMDFAPASLQGNCLHTILTVSHYAGSNQWMVLPQLLCSARLGQVIHAKVDCFTIYAKMMHMLATYTVVREHLDQNNLPWAIINESKPLC